MLQIKGIKKEYKTGDLIQKALDDVSLSFRDSELVSILGPSGSGKTTMLNIIGGLDSYDSGDLIINGVSTKKYKDRDWDTYRNYTIGFVFQSYNLIPHQTVLGNVELALTIGGVSNADKRERAISALSEVGLKEHIHKKPNQLSGGQMQRVAIARALVNNPDVLLADEPTGALDSETSVQILELLKEVAKDRLVVMVTHNAELAEEYSTRIVKLKDGKIIGDTNPFIIDVYTGEESKLKNAKKAKMSALTSFALSFRNLATKKRRTFFTAFAGSIGIIGIALILSLSTGVNEYIETIQTDTMASYPLTIEAEAVSIPGMGSISPLPSSGNDDSDETDQKEAIYSDYTSLERAASMVSENNLTEFKVFLEDPESGVSSLLGENGIVYSYATEFSVYSYDKDGELVNSNTDPEELIDASSQMAMMGGTGEPGMNPFDMMMVGTSNSSGADNFSEIMSGGEDQIVSTAITESYTLVNGEWPTEYNEVILFVDENNSIPLATMYQLGLVTLDEYTDISDQINDDEEAEKIVLNFEEVLGQSFYMITESSKYMESSDGIYSSVSDEYYAENESEIKSGTELKIVGIATLNEDQTNGLMSTQVGYTSKLTDYIIAETNESQVVMAQEADSSINVLNGLAFTDEINEEVNATYNENLKMFGKVSYDAPSTINIYTNSFESKEELSLLIETYNSAATEDNQIIYTDYVELMTSSMTMIIDIISYVLIAFVSVSLIVSCIMIGIITHISVMERTKEIGVLRALGASKLNISQVFNAETVIIGLCSGILGVGLTLLLNVPITSIIQNLVGNETVTVSLPLASAVLLIVLSVIITVIGGFLPAKNASKKDPVIALRTE